MEFLYERPPATFTTTTTPADEIFNNLIKYKGYTASRFNTLRDVYDFVDQHEISKQESTRSISLVTEEEAVFWFVISVPGNIIKEGKIKSIDSICL